ncbi:hypothetical protein FRB99_003062 [Tulasnella sp. 403]|nr:hypothetical protein FRB99_003062 [Tulasnella sp. 403]
MVYIKSWQQFQHDAEALYAKSPNTARYCIKWRHIQGTLVLKVTDNVTCLKYKMNSALNFHRFQALNLSLTEKMQNRKLPAVITPATVASVAAEGGSPRPSSPSGGHHPHGGGKKKGGKKKR